MNIYHLNCVVINAPAGGKAIGHCLLLEYSTGLVLVDAGIGVLDTLNPPGRLGQALIDMVGFRFDEQHTAYRQIEKLGFDPADVQHCVLTHLDPDHIGGLADFPNLKLHVSRKEYNDFYSGNPRYLTHQLAHGPVVHAYGSSKEQWYGLEASRVNVGFAANILLVPLPGHTEGHCGVAIEKEEGWLLHVGDAYYYRIELETDEHPVSQLAALRADHNGLRLQSLEQIKQLLRNHPEIEIISTHDPAEFPAL